MNLIWNLNLALGKIFDLALLPFSRLNPFWGLAAISLFTGAVMVVIFKFVSNQEGIRRAKARVRGYFLEVWIYKHDFAAVIGAVGRILKANLSYMKFAVSPLLVLIIPVILIMAHLNLHYGFRPFRLQESALLTVKFSDSAPLRDTSLVLLAPEGLKIETTPVRALGKNEVTWRISALKPGIHSITVKWSRGEISKNFAAALPKIVRLAPKKSARNSFLDAFLNPGEIPLPKNSVVQAVYIDYPEAKIPLLRMEVHWIVIFFLLSIVAGFALKGILKVEI